MKKVFLISILSVLTATTGITQNCKVLLESISGTYDGECKSDKANGKGKAVGKDSYEGEFKAGYPDGKGIYTWENKDWFEGIWRKGQKEGDGVFHMTGGGTRDSALVGFWRKDKYAGRYEKAFKILSQSETVSKVDVTATTESKFNEISIILSSVSGGTNTLTSQIRGGTTLAKIKLTAVDVTKGAFDGYSEIPYQPKATKFIVKRVVYPFTAFFRSDNHFVEIAFYADGNYIVDMSVLQ